ncbi:MAG TPA: hypothetical protein VK973_05035 [Arenicellales bacterium]|nr:hypothetical protein [Arenicellales bacterium]
MNTPDAKCSRRHVLKLAMYSSLVTMASGLSTGCGLFTSDLEIAAQRKIETLNHLPRAREIGEAYMAQAPKLREHSMEQLARKLLEMMDLDPGEISEDLLHSLEDRLRARVRQDFEDENVVILGRWMLSKTETLLCALAAKT